MPIEPATRACPTCGEQRNPDEFYETSVECRACKRARSQQNRAAAAEKVALADRLIDALDRLATQGLQLGVQVLPIMKQPPVALHRQPEAWTEPQEVRP